MLLFHNFTLKTEEKKIYFWSPSCHYILSSILLCCIHPIDWWSVLGAEVNMICQHISAELSQLTSSRDNLSRYLPEIFYVRILQWNINYEVLNSVTLVVKKELFTFEGNDFVSPVYEAFTFQLIVSNLQIKKDNIVDCELIFMIHIFWLLTWNIPKCWESVVVTDSVERDLTCFVRLIQTTKIKDAATTSLTRPASLTQNTLQQKPIYNKQKIISCRIFKKCKVINK